MVDWAVRVGVIWLLVILLYGPEMYCLWWLSLCRGGPRMCCFFIFSLAGPGGIGSRGDFLVCWGHIRTGIFLCIGYWLLLVAGFKLFALFFMAFDGIENRVWHVFDHLGSGVGEVAIASSMFIVLWGGLTVGTGVWGFSSEWILNEHPSPDWIVNECSNCKELVSDSSSDYISGCGSTSIVSMWKCFVVGDSFLLLSDSYLMHGCLW